MSRYDPFPRIDIEGCDDQAWSGWQAVVGELKRACSQRKRTVLAVDCYPGVLDDEVLTALVSGLAPVLVVETSQACRSSAEIEALLARNITDDRVFGVLSCHELAEFLDPDAVKRHVQTIDAVDSGLILVYGVGASLLSQADLLVYADLARWEIQQRFRKHLVGNWCAGNPQEEFLRLYKRAYFIDWRVADRHKKQVWSQIDFWLDTNSSHNPKLITHAALEKALETAVGQPFRVVPFFDPGPWGGQWMKRVCNLDQAAPNYAWCFDGVPEENSLLLRFGSVVVEIPSIDLVFRHPAKLLGERVHARFGTEFPIRFDFLDTMEGGNLSLQVHPLTEYIQQTFGMHYTQDESYYMLDAAKDAEVYLGVKTGTDPQQFAQALRDAQEGGKPLEVERYVNRWPAKKHDHFLIPAGTVHCSGRNSMVLEVSATPYIFTFKLWDWGRVGMDGKPRPIHLDHGLKNVQWDRDTDWVKEQLINRIDPVASGDGWREERTGLHEREFIETRRHWFTKPVTHHTGGGVNVLNLIEGSVVLVESPEGLFEPFEVHYAETFIVPAAVGSYRIVPLGNQDGQEYATLKAYVRS